MPERDVSLLAGLLALARCLVGEDDLRAAVEEWQRRPEGDFVAVLAARARLDAPARDELARLAREVLASGSSAATVLAARPSTEDRLRTLRVADAPAAPAAEPPARPPARYILGPEIGRGGIGRVVEAEDPDIGRTVALKLLYPGAPDSARERFQWEARVTGRLEHPNIVPLHDVGETAAGEAFYCMKRIAGRDMGKVIEARDWPLRRLVEAFRDACRAVGYAHSKGIVHRDLKPANVMLGEFGEVLVLDWGLAKDVRRPGGPAAATEDTRRRDRSSDLSTRTMDGAVLGTPAYMPPEQALGLLDEIDARSDVWALGATLYEILAGRPPFEGRTRMETLHRVIHDPVAPPEGAPPELAAICVRALSKARVDRYPDAAALGAEVDAWLAGSLERERREREANGHARRAEEEAARWRRRRAEAREAAARARDAEETVKAHDPPEKKRPLWKLQDLARTQENEAAEALGEAEAAIASALSAVPEHAAALRLRAALAWELFLDAERSASPAQARHARRVAERFNDGSLDALLRGEGTLEVRARAYPCRCLVQGRDVAAEELVAWGLHPWSGRAAGAERNEDERALEASPPARLRVHAASCEAGPLVGADVWAWRYEERDRVLVPVTPGSGLGPPPLPNAPPAPLDPLFGGSPFRPHGPGLYLGRTPLAPRPWPMGSWLLVVAAPGRAPGRVPVSVGRGEAATAEPTLFAPEEIPQGALPVPRGAFGFQGDAANPYSGPAETLLLDDAFLFRFPITCREYAEFLNALPEPEARRRCPRESNGAAPSWPCVRGRWVVPTAAWLARAPEADRAGARRPVYANVDWEEDWPAFGVSWWDAAAYARWASARDGRLLALPDDRLWEKAARGADRRGFVWGSEADAYFANINASKVSMGPSVVDSFPFDESPYGLRGLAGNIQQWVLNEAGRGGRTWQMIRGCSWPQSLAQTRSSIRTAATRDYCNFTVGFRLAAAVKVEGRAGG